MAKITVHGGPSSRYDPPVPPRPRARDEVVSTVAVAFDVPAHLASAEKSFAETYILGEDGPQLLPMDDLPAVEDEPEGGEQPSAGSSSETSTASTPRKSGARKANRPPHAPTTESP